MPISIYSLLFFGVIIAFCACGAKPSFSHALTYHAYEVIGDDKHLMLHIAKKDNAYHFALFDVFGAPIVSRVLENGSFSNDKFLRPNSSFDGLFLAILNAPQAKQVEVNTLKAVALDLSK